MNERPFPHGPLPQAPPSRRGFVVVGVLAAAAAGGGVWFATSSEDGDGESAGASPTVSHELRAAAEAERRLLATVTAAVQHAHGASRDALQLVRADHAAHLKAIEAAVADALYPLSGSSSAAPSGSSTAPPAGKVRIAEVRAAEQRAASAAAARAAHLTGRAAVLLATIAACEATHAELLAGAGT